MKYSPTKKEFVFGSLSYSYDLVMQKRKSLSLTVSPDLQICVKCPHEAGAERIESFLQKKWLWIEKQLRFFRKYQRKTYQRDYLSGEGFLYLGRQYKLVVKSANKDKVSMTKGVMTAYTAKNAQDGKHTKKLLEKWYERKIDRVFHERYKEMKLKFDYKKMPTLVIREMRRRWGSYSEKGIIILNPKLIHAPKSCIDYVIVHELCHARHKDHSKRFYGFLEQKYPLWKKAKEKLEIIGIQTR